MMPAPDAMVKTLAPHITFQQNKFGDFWLTSLPEITKEELLTAVQSLRQANPNKGITLTMPLPLPFLAECGFEPYYAHDIGTIWKTKDTKNIPEAASAISSARAIIKKRNQVLVIEDIINQGSIQFPGGACDKDELPEEAVLREAKEETGLDILKPQLISVMSAKQRGDYKKTYYLHCFLVKKFTGEIMPQAQEVSQVFWVNIKDLMAKEVVHGLKVPDYYKAMLKGVFHQGHKRIDLIKTDMACEGYMNFFPI